MIKNVKNVFDAFNLLNEYVSKPVGVRAHLNSCNAS